MSGKVDSSVASVLGFLLEDVVRKHISAAPDRRALHTLEWDEDDESWSLLGEVEYRDGTIAGIAMRLAGGARLERHHREDLERAAILDDEKVLNWLTSRAAEFPAYASYLLAVELLRATSLRFLPTMEAHSSPGKASSG